MRYIGKSRLYLAVKPAETAVAPTDVILLSDVERFVSREVRVKQAMKNAVVVGQLGLADSETQSMGCLFTR